VTSGAVKSLRAMDQQGRHALNIAIAQNNGVEALSVILEIDPGQAVWGAGLSV
jgi:hypothetical protein